MKTKTHTHPSVHPSIQIKPTPRDVAHILAAGKDIQHTGLAAARGACVGIGENGDLSSPSEPYARPPSCTPAESPRVEQSAVHRSYGDGAGRSICACIIYVGRHLITSLTDGGQHLLLLDEAVNLVQHLHALPVR